MTRLLAPVCFLLGVWYSLRSWNPATALGWLPIDGHDYTGEPWADLVCDRCGHVEKFVGYAR